MLHTSLVCLRYCCAIVTNGDGTALRSGLLRGARVSCSSPRTQAIALCKTHTPRGCMEVCRWCSRCFSAIRIPSCISLSPLALNTLAVHSAVPFPLYRSSALRWDACWIAVKYLLGGGFSRSPRTWSSSSARHSPSVFDYLISLIILISREIKKRAVLPAPTLVRYPTKVDFPL